MTKLMGGLPSNIKNFHDSYHCPICALTKETCIPKLKHAVSPLFFCF